jgi:hypothetical protein
MRTSTSPAAAHGVRAYRRSKSPQEEASLRGEHDWPPQLPAEVTPEQASALYDRLLQRLKDVTDASRRSALGLILVAIVWELLDRAAISEVSVGGFQISDLSVVRRVLPVVGAYFIFDLVSNGFRYYYTRDVVVEMDKHYSTRLHDVDVTRLCYPVPPSLFGPLVWYRTNTPRASLVAAFNAALRLGSVTIPVLLEVRWYVRLFADFGPDDLLLWLSLVCSTGLIMFAGLLAIEGVDRGIIGPSRFLRGQ